LSDVAHEFERRRVLRVRMRSGLGNKRGETIPSRNGEDLRSHLNILTNYAVVPITPTH
jgi:hypothetical protein